MPDNPTTSQEQRGYVPPKTEPTPFGVSQPNESESNNQQPTQQESNEGNSEKK